MFILENQVEIESMICLECPYQTCLVEIWSLAAAREHMSAAFLHDRRARCIECRSMSMLPLPEPLYLGID